MMKKKFKPYIDTHIHTHYSVLDGVSSPRDNVLRAKECGSPALAISDHGTVAGIFEFYDECKKNGIIPLIGNELYFKEDLTERDKGRKYFHGVFIAQNEVGFKNLMWLSSKGFEPDTHYQYGRPVVSVDEILAHSEGLVFSTGCMVGIVGTAQNRPLSLDEADNLISRFREVFQDRMFIELGPAQVCTDWKPDDPNKKAADKVWTHRPREEKEVVVGPHRAWTNCLQIEHNMRGRYFSKKYNIPVVIASDGHMCRPELKEVQDLLITSSFANKNGWHFHQINSMLSSEETWVEMQKNHSYVSERDFEEMIDNTYRVLDFCKELELHFGPMVPRFPLEKHPLYKDGMGPRDLMFAIIKENGRMVNSPEYLSRLQDEIKVICDNGVTDYTDYFLILSDIVRMAADSGVGVGPARGSAGGCLMSYLLGITAIDPIKYNLSFTRFLNEGRVKKGALPDIDMDFTDKAKIIEKIYDRYGVEYTAMVGSFQTNKTKGALKDIVRFMNKGSLPNTHPIHKLTKTIENAPQYYPSEKDFLVGFTDSEGTKHPGHLDQNHQLRRYLDDNPKTKKYLFSILEKPRSLGRHAGGVVITPTPIDECIPTRYFNEQKCTQIDYKTLEKIGGLKIDILGVNTLNWIWDTVDLVKERHGVELDPWNLPHDPGVFKDLSSGDVSTVFQFDTPTVRPYLKKIEPQSIYDLAVITSVCRPGALDSKLEDGQTVAKHFVSRRLGIEEPKYLDKILEDLLKDTYGLVIFQEQIQKLFEIVGGLTPVESDNARRAVGKKQLKPMLEAKEALFKGARKIHGWNLEKCEELWNSFEGAVNYSFNKAHAIAYAIIAYACAYLKHYYKAEWWASVLSNMESEKIKAYLSEIKDVISMPHVNRPNNRWVIEDGKLQAPLNLVRGVAGSAVNAISEKAPFSDMEDFFKRVNKTKVTKTSMLNMAVAGCFDGLSLEEGSNELDFTVIQRVNRIMELRESLLKKKNEELPKEYKFLSDRVKKVQLRSHMLPIETFNILNEFFDIVSSNSGYSFNDGIHFLDRCPLVANYDLFKPLSAYGKDVALVGIVTDSKTFYFNDKKTGKKVGALRVSVENDGRVTEVVLWPSFLKKLDANDKKNLQSGSLVAIFGPIKYNSFKGEYCVNYRRHKLIV